MSEWSDPVGDTVYYHRYEQGEFGMPPACVSLHHMWLPVVRETPCGVWLRQPYSDAEVWVKHSARKRYAYPTEAEALAGFLARKRRQVELLTGTLDRAKLAIGLATCRLAELAPPLPPRPPEA